MTARRTITPAELRRITTAGKALRIVSETPRTKEDAETQVEQLCDGIRALQSTDDLGYDELNGFIWEVMLLLERRVRVIKEVWRL